MLSMNVKGNDTEREQYSVLSAQALQGFNAEFEKTSRKKSDTVSSLTDDNEYPEEGAIVRKPIVLARTTTMQFTHDQLRAVSDQNLVAPNDAFNDGLQALGGSPNTVTTRATNNESLLSKFWGKFRTNSVSTTTG